MLIADFKPFPVLETERMVLEQINMEHLADLFLLRSDMATMQYISRPVATSEEDIAEIINKISTLTENNDGIVWGIRLKEREGLIGTIGYHRLIKEHYRAEMGYMLLPGWWKQGLMTEAANRVLDYGFGTLGLNSIEAHINPQNIKSARLLVKLNFVKEAYLKENFFKMGTFEDTEIYSLLHRNRIR